MESCFLNRLVYTPPQQEPVGKQCCVSMHGSVHAVQRFLPCAARGIRRRLSALFTVCALTVFCAPPPVYAQAEPPGNPEAAAQTVRTESRLAAVAVAENTAPSADQTGQAAVPMFSPADEAAGSARPVFSAADCEALVEQYYRMQPVEPQPLLDSFDRVREALLAAFDAEQLDRYFAHAKLISMLYVYEGNRQCRKYDRIIEAEAPGFLKQAGTFTGTGMTKAQTAALYVRYADYLYTKIALPENTFKIVSALPVLYRKAIMLDPDNTEAAVKLACWHIFPADVSTLNYNSFIEAQEEYLEMLSDADRFNAYVLYSSYYMKKYDSDKGRAYLQKAAALFPGHALLSHILENYRQGIFSL